MMTTHRNRFKDSHKVQNYHAKLCIGQHIAKLLSRQPYRTVTLFSTTSTSHLCGHQRKVTTPAGLSEYGNKLSMDEPFSDCFLEDSLNATCIILHEHAAMSDGPADLDGWMIPRALWLTEDAVSREAESTPNFWSIGLCDAIVSMPSMPLAKLDVVTAANTVDQFDSMVN